MLTSIRGKLIPTITLHNQLSKPANDIAGGLGPCLNNSAPMNCGMDPEI